MIVPKEETTNDNFMLISKVKYLFPEIFSFEIFIHNPQINNKIDY